MNKRKVIQDKVEMVIFHLVECFLSHSRHSIHTECMLNQWIDEQMMDRWMHKILAGLEYQTKKPRLDL